MLLFLSRALSCALLASLTLTTHANVQTEPELLAQSQSMRGGQTLSVLITYKRDMLSLLSPTALLTRADIQRRLVLSTRENENRVFARTPLSNISQRRTLWIVHGTVAQVTAAQLQTLTASPNVSSLSRADRNIHFRAPTAQPRWGQPEPYTYGLKNVGVEELRKSDPALIGGGVRVGILDTGIEPDHPDLKGKMDLYKNFSPAKNVAPADGFGHGTHVAGTIAGGDASGTAIGVAPAARLVVGRIFDDSGNSTVDLILQSMQWMADPDGDPSTADQPVAVNNSWGDDSSYKHLDPKDEPMCAAVETWVSLGIIPVFAAGNSGPAFGTIGVPAACPLAIAIAATNERDQSPHFSSAGPARWKSGDLLKPELSAPGVDVRSSTGSWGYEEMSGTSMAAPHATGVFALLKQFNPALTVDEAHKALVDGALDLGDPGKDYTFGSGRIDIYKSVQKLKGN